MATSESCSLSCFLICHWLPFLMVTSGTLRDVLFGGSGRKWCTATPLICFLISVLFFFANFLFAAQSTPSTLLANGHGPPLPRGPTSSNYRLQWWQGHMATLTCPLTCPHLTLSLHPHMPCQHALAAHTATTTSPCSSWLHALHHCACTHFPLLICFPFLILLTPTFFSPLTTLLRHHVAWQLWPRHYTWCNNCDGQHAAQQLGPW